MDFYNFKVTIPYEKKLCGGFIFSMDVLGIIMVVFYGYFTEFHKEVQSFTESPELELDEIINSLHF